MGSTVGAVIMGIVSLGCFFLGIMQLKEKGFLFNNAYLYASKEERQKLNKKPHYRQSGIIFILISIVFAVDAVEMIMNTGWLLYVVIIIAIAAIIYAIASSVRIEGSEK